MNLQPILAVHDKLASYRCALGTGQAHGTQGQKLHTRTLLQRIPQILSSARTTRTSTLHNAYPAHAQDQAE
jgi:hypothetical protein